MLKMVGLHLLSFKLEMLLNLQLRRGIYPTYLSLSDH